MDCQSLALLKNTKGSKATPDMTLRATQDATKQPAADRKWNPSEVVQQVKSTLRHGDIVSQVQHGRGGLGLGIHRPTWQRVTLAKKRGPSVKYIQQ